MKIINCIALLVFALISACATVTSVDSQADQQAKRFETKSGKSLIYVYRESGFFAGGVKHKFQLDGKPIGEMIQGGYMVLEVVPGKHSLVARAENDAILNSTLEAGKNYYIKQALVDGLGALTRTTLKVTPEEIAKEEIKKCSLIQWLK